MSVKLALSQKGFAHI